MDKSISNMHRISTDSDLRQEMVRGHEPIIETTWRKGKACRHIGTHEAHGGSADNNDETNVC